MSPRRREPLRADPTPDELEDADRWVTVKEAAEAADVAIGTVRKWYSGDEPDVPSRLEPGPTGPQRMLPLAAVLERAERTRPTSSSSTPTPAAATPDAQALPPDMLPIRRADWDRLMEQIGNLHAAGQELAEARERAAKAETEAAFLRERLEELRQRQAAEQTSTSSSSGPGWWSRTFGTG